jgi:hypothetical protein
VVVLLLDLFEGLGSLISFLLKILGCFQKLLDIEIDLFFELGHAAFDHGLVLGFFSLLFFAGFFLLFPLLGMGVLKDAVVDLLGFLNILLDLLLRGGIRLLFLDLFVPAGESLAKTVHEVLILIGDAGLANVRRQLILFFHQGGVAGGSIIHLIIDVV